MVQFKKVVLAITIGMVVSSPAYAERITAYDLPYWVKHFYEFDSSSNENKYGYWWCGQTALKIVLNHIKGIQYSLQSIHNTLLYNNGKSGTTGSYYENNCPGSSKYCAYLEDLVYASNYSYGLPASIRTVPNRGFNPTLNDKVQMFNIIRDASISKKLLIGFGTLTTSPSPNTYSPGHAWVIMGFDSNNVQNPWSDPSNVYVFLRDNNVPFPLYPEMDRWVTIDTLYKMMAKNTNNPLKLTVF